MKRQVLLLMTTMAMLALTACRTTNAAQPFSLFDLEQQKILPAHQGVARLEKARIILVGEHHHNSAHHRAQLKVIQALHQAGRRIAIGLEMFRRDSQSALDQWVAGQIGIAQFKPIYLDNWNFDWELYRPIFSYARQNRIAMVGLNVSREITAQVAYHGFSSLDASQRGALEGITCDVTDEYRDFIRQAYGAHGHGRMNFDRFCEAQLVWDSAMAVHAIDFLKAHPDTTLVILAGSGHAQKLGIPSQLAKRGQWPYVVLLPETEGVFDARDLSMKEADFIILKD